jgi:phosphoribosylamine--glycine ligase
MISRFAEGAHLLWLIKDEGNEVALWVESPLFKDAWEGILPRVDKWQSHVDDDTVVIFDTTGLGKEADKLRAKGVPTFGGSEFADSLEKDRLYGIRVMEQSGIKVPQYCVFNDSKSAIEFIHAHPDMRMVFKPYGGDEASALTYVSEDSEDLLGYIKYLESLKETMWDNVVLQEFKEGVSVDTWGWTDGTKFVPPFIHTIEDKKFMNDDKGPGTGCAGNIVWIEPHECRAIREGIARVRPRSLVGLISLNTIVNDEGIWGLEWTPRFGYDDFAAYIHLMGSEVGKLISDFAHGQAPDELDVIDEVVAAGVRLSVPPYPSEPVKEKPLLQTSGLPINGIPHRCMKNMYFYEVKLSEDGEFVHSEGIGNLAAVSSIGEDVHDAFDKVYNVVDTVKVPDLQYRTDMGEVLNGSFQKFMPFDT